jgi:hypothetical protein
LGVLGADRAPARAATVPDVVLSTASAEGAPAIEAPVAEVTVFSDRARVRRRGRLPAGRAAGVATVRLPDLPGATFLDTVRVAADGARVLRVEATPVERERLSIEQAVKLLDELDGIDDALAELADREELEQWEVDWLGALRPAPPVPEEKRQGRKALVVDVPSWARALDFIAERGRRARERLAKIADERRVVAERRQRVRAEIAQINQGGFSDRRLRVVAVVQAPAGGATPVELEYFVPGARWKPAYDLHFAPGRGQLRLETAAVVEQTTGEDWPAAALSFSTAIPGRGIDAPELLTWTLGERSELVPQLRPRAAPHVETPLPPPTIRASAAEAVQGEVVRARIASALQRSGEVGDVVVRPKAVVSEDAAGALGKYNRREPPRPVRRYAAPAPSSAPSGAPAAAPAMAESYDLAEEAEAPPPARLMTTQSLISRTASEPRTSMSLALYDTGSARAAPTFSDPLLPAVSAGGLDYVYQAPTPLAIPSTGRQVRVPLASQTFATTAFHDATPALAATAFLRARVRNDGKRPLLRGPATIFSDGELVGVGELQTTGPGGDIEFPLGADEDVRLVRQVVPSTKTTGLIMKSDETIYDVQIQVGNYKKKKVVVELRDQVPRSNNEKVDVKLLSTDPAPIAAPDGDGVVRWRVELAPGATRIVRLRYQIVRPKGWQLYQR